MPSLKGRSVLTIGEFNQDELYQILSKSLELKRQLKMGGELQRLLEGKAVAMIFHKPSCRTRMSFEVALAHLGARGVFLKDDEIKLGTREPIEDISRVLSGYVDAIVIRTFKQADVEKLAEHSTVPVINALTGDYHPCQILADLMTILESKDRLNGLKLAFVGDGNNVVNSLLLASGILGIKLSVASPTGYEPAASVVEEARSAGRHFNQTIKITNDPVEAVEDADIVYTDVWASMGEEKQKAERLKVFRNYQLDAELLSYAKPDACVMHCLPAHRGEEITQEVMESPQSVVFDQSENRLHTAKGLLSVVL